MSTKRDRFLTEQMGECWHEASIARVYHDGFWSGECHCGKPAINHITSSNGLYSPLCGSSDYEKFRFHNNNFSTWDGFGKLWEWVQEPEQDHIRRELEWYVESRQDRDASSCVIESWYIHPDRFADALYEFLQNEEQGD